MEAKSRVRGRIAFMEVEAALNLPPISLDVSNSDLEQVGVALSKATGKKVIVAGSTKVAGHFDVHKKDVPFWDVFEELRKQQPVWLRYSRPTDTAYLGADFPGQAVSLTPARFSGVHITTTASLVGPGNNGNRVTLTIGAGLDPRIIGEGSIALASVKDNAGREKSLRAYGNEPMVYTGTWTETPEALQDLKSISISGKLRLNVQVGEDKVVLDHPQTQINTPVTVAGHSATLIMFDVRPAGADGKRTLTIGAMLPDSPTARIPGLSTSDPPVPVAPANRGDFAELTVGPPSPGYVVLFDAVDATGKVVWTGRQRPGEAMGFASANVTAVMQEPLHVIVRSGVLREVTIPFEFKDVPVK